jgi:ribose 1,5-bisphosphokinase
MSKRGKLLLVIGASAAGKDTLVQWARRELPGASPIRIVEREITRGLGPHQHHVPVTDAEFARRSQSGYYLLQWSAHGVHYGIPGAVRELLDSGECVLTIASRSILPAARALACDARFIEIRAPRAVLEQRLLARGGRSDSELSGRLARADSFAPEGPDVHPLDNGGALIDSGPAFVALLLRLTQF